MTSKQESRLKMYLILKNFLLSYPEITANLPNFPEFLAALNAAIIQIQTNGEEHQITSKGVTDNKKETRDLLVTYTADASRKIQAYALYAKNTVLLAETKYTATTLKQLSSIKLLDASTGLYNRIDANLSPLLPYGLTPESQLNYKNIINDYAIVIPATREKQLNKKENALLVDQGFENADAACVNIDVVVEIVRLSEPNFYKGYRNARKVVEQGIGTLQVQGKVTNSATGNGITDATISFRLVGQTAVVIEKQTADKGGFNIKSLPEGMYTVTATKVGYKTQNVSATVSMDALCMIEIAMERL